MDHCRLHSWDQGLSDAWAGESPPGSIALRLLNPQLPRWHFCSHLDTKLLFLAGGTKQGCLKPP